MYDWDSHSDMIAELLQEGCILDIQEADEGPLVTFNLPVLELKYPAVAEVVKQDFYQEVDEALNNLVDMGLLQMAFQESEDGGIEPVFSLTEAGEQYVNNLRT